VQFPDILLEIDAATGYSEALLGRRAQSTGEPVASYGALLAHGIRSSATPLMLTTVVKPRRIAP
jgi:hypothetical protein